MKVSDSYPPTCRSSRELEMMATALFFEWWEQREEDEEFLFNTDILQKLMPFCPSLTEEEVRNEVTRQLVLDSVHRHKMFQTPDRSLSLLQIYRAYLDANKNKSPLPKLEVAEIKKLAAAFYLHSKESRIWKGGHINFRLDVFYKLMPFLPSSTLEEVEKLVTYRSVFGQVRQLRKDEEKIEELMEKYSEFLH